MQIMFRSFLKSAACPFSWWDRELKKGSLDLTLKVEASNPLESQLYTYRVSALMDACPQCTSRPSPFLRSLDRAYSSPFFSLLPFFVPFI